MSARKPVLLLILILSGVVLISAGTTIVLLYQSEFKNQRERLGVTVKSQARLIEALVTLEEKPGLGDAGTALWFILSHFAKAHDNFEAFGETGEFILAKRVGEEIVFLFRHHGHSLQVPAPVPFSSHIAEPMRLALMGLSGAVTGFDYSGETVLAAYEPVAGLGLGVVAKIDLAEIHAPFIRTGLITGVLALVAIALGASLFVRVTNPVFEQIKESRLEAQQVHARLIDAIENLPAAFALFDDEDRLVLFNSQVRNFFPECNTAGLLRPGTRYEEILRFSLQGFVSDIDGQEVEFMRDRMAQFKGDSSSDSDVPFSDGKVFRVMNRKTADGWTVNILLDISEQKRAEEELRESEQKFRDLIEQAPDAFIVHDLEGNILDVNRQACDSLGYTREELLAIPISQLEVHYDHKIALKTWWELAPGKTGSHEGESRRKDGSTSPVEVTLGRLTSGNRKLVLAIVRDISDRKRTEQALRDSERLLQAVFDTLPHLISVRDREGCFLKVNKAWSETLGASQDKVLHRHILDVPVWAENEGESVLKNDRDAFASERGTTEILQIRTGKNGERQYLHNLRAVLQDESGKAQGLVTMCMDITERKQVERDLRESEANFRNLIEASIEGIAVISPERKLMFANPALAGMFGCDSPEEMLGMNSVDFIAPHERQRLGEQFQRFFKGEAFSNRFEYQGLRKDGCLVWVDRHASRVIWRGQQASLSTYVDITELKQAEEENLRLAKAVEQTAEGVVITDHEGTIRFVNPGFERITGYAKEEVLGKNPRFLKSGAQDQKFYQSMWDTIADGKFWEGSLVNRKKDGSHYEEEMRISPIKDGSGNIGNFIAIKQDITERRRAEERIKLQEQQLIQADKMAAMGILVSGVAHEINNPNTAIMMNVPLLRKMWREILPLLQGARERDPELALASIPFDEAREIIPNLLSDILSNSRHINRIVENLKNFAKKRESRDLREIDLNEVVETALTLMNSQIKQMTHALSVEYGKDLPPFQGDFIEIEQVFINLVTNACQSLSSKKDGVRIATRFDSTGQRILVEVRDEGKGIPDKFLSQITDPFFTTKQETGGTGLGLSVSTDILKMYGGSLEFSSRPGKGTTATMILPSCEEANTGSRLDGAGVQKL